LTVLPESEAETYAPESALIAEAKAEAIVEVVVLEPLQLTVSAWPLTVTMLVPESYSVL